MRERLTIGPEAYSRVATVSFALLVGIVLTGAAVRLTGSGLGCPTWPQCNGRFITTELDFHGAVEYGNRLITGLVGVAVIAAALLALRRRPFRRDLLWLSLLLPLGVIGQIVLGGLVVKHDLPPELVMQHFLLSQLLVAASFALMWRARRVEDDSVPVEPRSNVLATRAIVPLAALILVLGTITTGAGPHPGTHGDQVAKRFVFEGGDTLHFMYEWHGRFSTLLGLSAVALWLFLRRHGARPALRRAVTVLCVLLAAQGAVGLIQWASELPAGLVWVHITLASATWIAVLYSVARAGRLASAQVAPQPPS
jgi:cytochrome c oxidase assembly protein subunit 15